MSTPHGRHWWTVVCKSTETESKETHGVWDPIPELTKTSPYVHFRVDTSTSTMCNPMPELTLSSSQGLWIWPQCTPLSTQQIQCLPCRLLSPILIIWVNSYVRIAFHFTLCSYHPWFYKTEHIISKTHFTHLEKRKTHLFQISKKLPVSRTGWIGN